MNPRTAVIYVMSIVAFCCGASAQTRSQEMQLDSLRNIYNNSADNTTKLYALDRIAYFHYSADSTITYAQMLIKLAKSVGDKQYEARGLDYLSWGVFLHGEYMKSCEHAFAAIKLAEELHDDGMKANNNYLLGHAYAKMQNQIKANEYWYKALEVYYANGDSSHICDILRNIADNNYKNAMYDAAEECLDKSLSIDLKRNDIIGLSYDNYYLGLLAYQQFDDHRIEGRDDTLLHAAKQYLISSRQYAIESGFGLTQVKASTHLGMTLIDEAETTKDYKQKQAKLDSCQMLLNEAYSMCDLIESFNERLDIDEVYIHWLIGNGSYKKAEQMIDSLCNELGKNFEIHSDYIVHFSKVRAKLYDVMGDYKRASECKDIYYELYNNSRQADYISRTAQSMANSNYEQRLRENELKYEANVEKHRTVTITVIIALVVVCVFIAFLNYFFIKSRRLNLTLEQQKKEIEMQNSALEERNEVISTVNQQITDSINYASLIQKAALPSEMQMSLIFGQNMVIYRPLNIVSGDFYWATQIDRLKLLAVADCTGHGVPGAFLSMLGISILNEIATHIDENNISAGLILDDLRSNVKTALHQQNADNGNHDGMDMALIIIDMDKMLMHYAGAFRPVFIAHDSEIIKLNADHMPIGVHHNEQEHFTDNIFHLHDGDTIYLFTDGITDQFGYDEDYNLRKFTVKQLRRLLSSIQDRQLNLQKTMIEMALDNWRSKGSLKECEQIDDATIIGIKIDSHRG